MTLVRKFTRRKKQFLTKIDNLHVNIIMLHVDIIYLACRGQKYATIKSEYDNEYLKSGLEWIFE